jgi:hypothetical protein
VTSGNANFPYWVPTTPVPDEYATTNQYFYPKCLEHNVSARSILEYPDGYLVARCTLCGDRISLQFNEHSILLRRAHEIAIAVVEASEDESVNYIESYHRLKERIESSEEAMAESRILLDRISEMLQKKTQGSLE